MPITDPVIQRRRISRLIIVAATLLFVTGGVYSLYLLNRTKRSVISDKELIAQALEANEQQAYDDVVRLLENRASNDTTLSAIQQDPELLRIYITARQTIPLYDNRHLSRIVTPLTQLIELDPEDIESRHTLLDTLMTLDRFDDALVRAEQLAKQHPDDAILLRQLARAQEYKGQFEAALNSLSQSIQIEPLFVQAHGQMLDLIEQYDQPIEPFIAQAQSIYEAHRDNPRAMLISALAHEAQGNGVQTRDLLKQASQLPPGDESIVTMLTQWLDRSGLYPTATAYLMEYAEQGIQTAASRMAIYRAFESNDFETILARLKDSDPNQANSDLLGMWASALFQTNKPEQGQSILELLEDRNNAIASSWVALISIDQQESTTPAQTIDTIVAVLENQDNEAIQAMARRHPYFMQRLGEAYSDALEPEAAYGAFSVAAGNTSSWARPHLGLAKTLIRLDEPAAALVHAREALLRDNKAESRQWLVIAMAGAANPNDSDIIDRILSEADKLPAGSEYAEQVLPAVTRLLAQGNRIEEGKQRVQAALDAEKTLSANTLESLLRVSNKHGVGLNTALTQAIESNYGMTPGLALIQASGKAELNGFESGLVSLEQATPEPTTKAWQTAMAEFLATYRAKDVSGFLAELSEQYPDDLALQLAALKASNPSARGDFFSEAILRLRNLAGESSVNWRLQQARLKMLDSDNTEALQETVDLLIRAQAFTPIHLELRLVSARCYMMLGEYEAAADRALAAKTFAPQNTEALLLNGMALHRLERYQAARLDLIPLAMNPRVDPATRVQACIMLNEQGDTDTVRLAVEQMWSVGQANNQALTMLARIYSGAGEFVKADQVCELLIQIPEAETIRFVSMYYHQTNRPELAMNAIRSAEAAGMGEADRLMVRAEDAAHRGQHDRALQLIEQAAMTDPDDPQSWVEAAQLALSLARPNDAIRLAKLGLNSSKKDPGLRALVQHQSLIQQIKADASLIPMAVTLLSDKSHAEQAATALRITGGMDKADEAALALAKLSSKNPGFKYLSELASDRLLSAGLEEQAFDLAKRAMARFPDSAAAARVTTLTAFRLQDWSMLLSAANAWAERNPRDRGNADLMRATAMNKLDRFSSAVKTLKPYAQAQPQITASNELLFESYTYALVKNNETAAAWQILEPHLSTSQQARKIALKRVSDDLTEADSAAQWVNQIMAVSSSDAQERFMIASASFLSGQRLQSDPLVRIADQTIAQLLSTPGQHSPAWRYAQGQIAQHLGELDEAEASYRSVMASLPDNPLVLNNLALVLAEQSTDALPEAEQLATRATQLASDNPNLLDTLAIIQLRQSRLDSALATIEKAIELDPSNPGWRLTQADIYEAKGETERAALIRERYEPRLQN